MRTYPKKLTVKEFFNQMLILIIVIGTIIIYTMRTSKFAIIIAALILSVIFLNSCEKEQLSTQTEVPKDDSLIHVGDVFMCWIMYQGDTTELFSETYTLEKSYSQDPEDFLYSYTSYCNANLGNSKIIHNE